MKTNFKIVMTILIAASSVSMAAVPKGSQSTQVDWQKAEQNYIAGLQSGNTGVRHSAATFIAEYQLTGAESNLISLLQKDKVEQVRMTAAAALIRIGNDEGRKAVEDAVVYDGSEKVAKFCEELIKATSHNLSAR
ncbi:MAG: HEAT repeat domain-containing protein [Bacteroidota bacterium]|jgi:HEAT repeat protein